MSLENKQGFPASTCYLVDGWLKEPLPGQFDHVD